ncbi:MAG TPA: T9SS type A sorting domain-containing protein [Bacteroidota bacterium]|nr:T9SS type A sorting domain-containing protein [Bacteroidota bacterium]
MATRAAICRCVVLGVVFLNSTTLAVAQPLRIGIHKPIPPGTSTFDTLGFYPPTGPLDSESSSILRKVLVVAVRLDSIRFPEDDSLDIALIHDGTFDTVVYQLTTRGANFEGTVLADTALLPLSAGSPPYTGEYSPSRPLSHFVGSESSGTWILQLSNHTRSLTGTLEQWGVAIDFSLIFTSVRAGVQTRPDEFILFQNFPNPFNPSTVIRYRIPYQTRVTLTLYNMLGERVGTLVDGDQEAGDHQLTVSGSGLASGVYYYSLRAGMNSAVRRLLLLR